MLNTIQEWISLWRRNHQRAFKQSLQQLWRHRLGSLLSFFSLGLCLAIPLTLYSVTHSLTPLTKDWQKGAKLSIFLKKTIEESEKETLMQKLARSPLVSSLRYESPTQVLDQFKEAVNLPELVNELPQNPLPGIITFIPNTTDLESLTVLKNSLLANTSVDDVVMDTEWLAKVQTFVNTLHHTALVLSVLFGTMAVFVVQNTLRLTFTKHQEEIRLLSLIGATKAFIRRPFLYRGTWIGLISAVFSLIILWSGLFWFSRLTNFPDLLQGISIFHAFLFLGIGATLGWIGARLATITL